PFVMTIAGKNRIQLKNVYVGDVWICSGQSNMEWPLIDSANAKEAIDHSKNSKIRLFTVPKTTAAAPQQTVQGPWSECGPQWVTYFSAVAYFFGRDLQKALDVPIGLIHTSWGGTPAEAWTSRAALEAEPALKHYADRQAKILEDHTKILDRYITDLTNNREKILKSVAEGQQFPAPPPVMGMNPHVPASLYNGMIAPLLPYAIRGAIWYQGESNAGRAY